MKNPRFINPNGGILIEQDSGVDLYVDSGDLYAQAVSGAFGPVAAYVAPPEPPAPSTVPQVVSRFQARAALHLAGLLPQVDALMADPATDMLARLAWQDAAEFRRTSPVLLAMSAALGLTDAQIDDLFTTAHGVSA